MVYKRVGPRGGAFPYKNLLSRTHHPNYYRSSQTLECGWCNFEGVKAFQKGLCYSFPTPHYNNQSQAEQGYYTMIRCHIHLIALVAEAIFLQTLPI